MPSPFCARAPSSIPSGPEFDNVRSKVRYRPARVGGRSFFQSSSDIIRLTTLISLFIEGTERDSFGEVFFGDARFFIHVGNRSGDFENPMMGSSTHAEFIDDSSHDFVPRIVEFAVFAHLSHAHLRIAPNRSPRKSLSLERPARFDALADACRWLGRFVAQKIVVRHFGDFELYVDPVEQWPRYSRLIHFYHFAPAHTSLEIAPQIPARARIHRGDEHELRREPHALEASSNIDRTIFEWLAQDFEHSAFELGQFVEKQNAVMR